MRKRSELSQLIINYDIIGNDPDKGVQNDIIFLDFSKAFDKVPHNLLLHKLKTFGFNNKLLNCFTDHLSERSQSVIVEGKQSKNLPVTSGVPQGPILEIGTTSIYTVCTQSTSDSDVLQNYLKLIEI